MKELRTCYILRGYSGSGKSTFAEQLKKDNENTQIVSADYFWIDSKGNYNFDVTKLGLAHKSCFENFKELVSKGSNVIIDNTNLKYTDFTKYIDYLLVNNNQNNFVYSVKFIEVSHNCLEEAIKYRTNRVDGKNIPESKLKDMYKLFKKDVRGNLLRDYKGKISLNNLDELSNDLPWKAFEENSCKTPAIICDLDGTISIFEYLNGVALRDCYNASTSNSDIINVAVAEALRGFFTLGYEILFVSGREDVYREPTEEFLERVKETYKINYSKLFMRKAKDYRKDFIIKEEIYENFIKNEYNVLAVFDDRPQVIEMWRKKGLFVFDCNYRGINF